MRKSHILSIILNNCLINRCVYLVVYWHINSKHVVDQQNVVNSWKLLCRPKKCLKTHYFHFVGLICIIHALKSNLSRWISTVVFSILSWFFFLNDIFPPYLLKKGLFKQFKTFCRAKIAFSSVDRPIVGLRFDFQML